MTVRNSGREPPLPPKGINVNSSNLQGLAVGPQPRAFSGKMPPRVKKGPMDWGASRIPYYPHRQEGGARHV